MTRILTAIVGILILIPLCFVSHTFIWPLALSVFSFIAVCEVLSCIGASKEKGVLSCSLAVSLMPILVYLLTEFGFVENAYQCLFALSALYFISVQMVGCLVKNRIETRALYASISLVLYVSVSFTGIYLIRFLDHGNQEGVYVYLLVFLGAWISDTFAYFCGRLFGRHKLAPEISPKKTVEGSIGGILGNMICFCVYAFILRKGFDVNASLVFFAILGALFSAIGQFGDLFASCIKRHFGVKDFGKLFPGHGGVLDRFDSTLAISLCMLILDALFGSSFLIS